MCFNSSARLLATIANFACAMFGGGCRGSDYVSSFLLSDFNAAIVLTLVE